MVPEPRWPTPDTRDLVRRAGLKTMRKYAPPDAGEPPRPVPVPPLMPEPASAERRAPRPPSSPLDPARALT